MSANPKPMFDITPDDISQLNDIDLRELVARLCEAEVISHGLSPVSVTWGGNQTAADGGLDVRVTLPVGDRIKGFIPRPSTGFQVKKPDMPRSAILKEMRPDGVIRPTIQELADEAGAYVIVSATGSTTESALRNRQKALREGLDDVDNAEQLQTDFYDRTRLATWVRRHPGLITWVKEKVGRSVVGWFPYGPWSGAAEDVDAEYLLDDKLRLHFGTHDDASPQSITQAIDRLRAELAQSGKMVRLVGLSGVGKTRLAQALFDERIGTHPLPAFQAVYTNLSYNPDPQPVGLASDLMANRVRAVLIIDNCPAELHRNLSDLCGGANSTISVLTIEYDVRDDQPEGTQVVTLDTSSPTLIEQLVHRRCPKLSSVDVHTIAEFSGGNARIAVALAETVRDTDTIAGLSNDELFQRLFQQRQEPNEQLFIAAQACSLVYSFQGETLSGEDAELPRLALLAGQTTAETYRHVSELLRRDLVQKRGVWRAVLPHAVANHLASRALENTPYELINEQLLQDGTERLALSFSRRLSFLHDSQRAVTIAESWLEPRGILGNVTTLSNHEWAMFENIAPVAPEAVLTALERVQNDHPNGAEAGVLRRRRLLLRSLAYDPALFQRSVYLLSQIALQSTNEQEATEASDAFTSLFTICLSGTHASIEQRLAAIERLFKSVDTQAHTLGFTALKNVLQTMFFSSSYQFEFGARSRDHGYNPRSREDVARWYGAALAFIERIALTENVFKAELQDSLAQNFRGLWTVAEMYDDLERLSREFAVEGFWREGWYACRQTMHFDSEEMTPDVASRLSDLERDLKPTNLQDRVNAFVLGKMVGGLDPLDIYADTDRAIAFKRLNAIARELGATVALNETAFAELLPELLQGGDRVWAFGQGLAFASPDRGATWARLVDGLGQIYPDQRNIQVFRGFLAELEIHNRELAQRLLDQALDQPVLRSFLPLLQSAAVIDERGVERLMRALRSGCAPVWMYRNLAFGRTLDHLRADVLKDLLILIADQPEGSDVALDILSMRLHTEREKPHALAPELLVAGRELLQRTTFDKTNMRGDHELIDIVKVCLAGPDSGPVAAQIAIRLRRAVMNYQIHSIDNSNLLSALLEVQPILVLDVLFEGDESDQKVGVHMFDHFGDSRHNPANVIPSEALVAWCNEDPERRYPLAASIITFACRPNTDGPKVWSEQAHALLGGAPNPMLVLEAFTDRFRPMNWRGSRAALIEENARLLDSLPPHTLPNLMSFVIETKSRLAQEIARERQCETERDRGRDERFE